MGTKITPPKRGQEIVTDLKAATLRVAKFFELISENLWNRQYVSGVDTGFNITGPSGFSLVRGTAEIYETDGGAWRIISNINYTHDSLTSVDVTIADLIFKTGPVQKVGGFDAVGTATTRARVLSGSLGVIKVDHSVATTSTALTIIVELDGKPPWVI